MKRELCVADLNSIALVEYRVRNSLPIDERACGGMMIDDLVVSLIHFLDRCMQATDRQIFQKNIARAAPTDGHNGEQLDIVHTIAALR